jgi:hypothetical protein
MAGMPLTQHAPAGLHEATEASSGYRFARYYTRDRAHRRKGPPPALLRWTAPGVVVTTLVVLVTGVWLRARATESQKQMAVAPSVEVGRERLAFDGQRRLRGRTVDLEPDVHPVALALDSPAVRQQLDDPQAPAARVLGRRAGQVAELEPRAGIAHLDAQRLRRRGHPHRHVILAVPDGVRHQLRGQQLRVLQPRCADQVKIAVERRERLASRRGRLEAARQAQDQQCVVGRRQGGGLYWTPGGGATAPGTMVTASRWFRRRGRRPDSS